MSCSPRKERPRTPGADELGEEVHSGWLKKSDASVLGSLTSHRRWCALHQSSDLLGTEPTICYFEDQAKTKPKGHSVLSADTELKLVDEVISVTQGGTTVKLKADSSAAAMKWQRAIEGAIRQDDPACRRMSNLEADEGGYLRSVTTGPAPKKVPATPPAKRAPAAYAIGEQEMQEAAVARAREASIAEAMEDSII